MYLSERNIYGSSRIGMEQVGQIIAYSDNHLININDENGIYTTTTNDDVYAQKIGDKHYELSNLPISIGIGNVLEVITDRKLAVESTTISGTVDYYTADVISQNDYFTFGMLLPNRHESASDYRYGFQGQEKDDEIKGEGNSVNYRFRMHDPRIGRFFAVDPLTAKYPHYTPYSFSGNKVINSIELEGLEDLQVTGNILDRRPYLNIPFFINYSTPNATSIDLSKPENKEIKQKIESQTHMKLKDSWHIQVNANVVVKTKIEEDNSLTDSQGNEYPILFMTKTTTVNYTIKIYDANWKEIKNVKNTNTTTTFKIGILNEGNGEGTPDIYWEDAPLKEVKPKKFKPDDTEYKKDEPIDSTNGNIYLETEDIIVFDMIYKYKGSDGKNYYKINGYKTVNKKNKTVIDYYESTTSQPKYHPVIK